MESGSRSQGCPGNRPAEGRLGKSRERMNKNCIKGRTGEASWHHTAKPSDPVRTVNAAVARWRTAFLPGEIPRWQRRGKSAEAIVPLAGRGLEDARINCETGTTRRTGRAELVGCRVYGGGASRPALRFSWWSGTLHLHEEGAADSPPDDL